jgi:hypothetical protein
MLLVGKPEGRPRSNERITLIWILIKYGKRV